MGVDSMKKLFSAPGLVLAMLVTACGDNGFRSPDFDAVLIDVVVDGPAGLVINNANCPSNPSVCPQAQYRALGHFTTPPSTQGAIATSDITGDADWTVVQVVPASGGQSPEESCRLSTQLRNDVAVINDNGLLTAVLAQGTATVYVKATFGDKAGCRPITITRGSGGPTQPELVAIQVLPETATVPAGTTQQYCARGLYSDAPTTPREITGTAVVWNSENPAVATVPAAPNNTGGCITATGVAVGNTLIRATASGLTDTGTINVTTAVVVDVLRVVPEEATVVITGTQQFVACGTFSDGSNATTGPCSTPEQGEPAGQPIPNSQIDWTSGNETIATVDDTGVATGEAVGTTQITATLKPGAGNPNSLDRSASGTLNVSNLPQCTTPIVATEQNGVTVDVEDGPLCVACSVENEDDVVDQPPPSPSVPDDTPATINATLSVLDLLNQGYIYLSVNAADGDILGGENATEEQPGLGAGFFIGRPINDLLLAEVLETTSVTTFLNGEEVDNATGESNTLVLVPLGAPLLGPGLDEQPLLIGIEGVTGEYDELRLTFSPTVASVLSQLRVYNACSEVTFPPEEEAP
jgi:hypothetical protein